MPNEPILPDGAVPEMKRRLATILAADVFGYSRMMGENEELTVQTLRGHRAVFDALLKQHHGRVFNTAGDAILAEFPSAVEAVRCATEIQSALQTRNEHLPPAQKMLFRMGINLGDVVVQDGDLLGDGVNVAARIESIAEPGDICISGSVYDQIQNKLSLQFNPLGDQNFKNIAQPIRTFTITHGESGALPSAPRRPAGKSLRYITVGTVIALVLTAGAFWLHRDNEAKRLEQNTLTAQLAAQKQVAEEARRTAEEQKLRAADAERKAEEERTAAESAKREAALKIQAESAEAAQHRAEAEKRSAEEQRLRAAEALHKAEEARVASENSKQEADKHIAETKENGQTKSIVATTSINSAGTDAKMNSSMAGAADKGKFDGIYNGTMCLHPYNPDKKKCWPMGFNVHDMVGTGSWVNHMTGKTSNLHATIAQHGDAKITIEGWKADGTAQTGTMNGRLVGDSIDAEGGWESGARLNGHWAKLN